MIHFRAQAALIATLTLIGCTAPPIANEAVTVANNSADAITVIDEPENAAAMSPAGGDALTPAGLGTLRIGMTKAEVVAAMGASSGSANEPGSCEQFHPARAPEGVLAMLEQGKLTRISLIRDAAVKTDAGLGIGSTQAQVSAIYGERIKTTSHKYMAAPAGYMTIWTHGSGGPGSLGIVYEVSEGRVTAIHAGGPSIQYVEGCS